MEASPVKVDRVWEATLEVRASEGVDVLAVATSSVIVSSEVLQAQEIELFGLTGCPRT